MTDALRAGTGGFLPRTTAPGRQRPGVGIVWLDRLSLAAGARGHPAFGSDSVVKGFGATAGGRDVTVGTTVEVPPGYLVVDVRVGYATAAGTFVGELRIVDLEGARKSALVMLEGRGGSDRDEPGGRSDGPPPVFFDARTAPAGERTLLTVRASVTDDTDHVAVRGLRVHLTRA